MKKLVLISESKNYLYFIGKDKHPCYPWYRIKKDEWNSKKDGVKLIYTSHQGVISVFEVDEILLNYQDSFEVHFLTAPYDTTVDPEAKTLTDLINEGYNIYEDEWINMYIEMHPTIAFLTHKDFGCVGIVNKMLSGSAIIPEDVFEEMKIKLSQQLSEDDKVWVFEISQNGKRLSSGTNPDKEKCLFEAMCEMNSYSEEQFGNLVLTVKKGE